MRSGAAAATTCVAPRSPATRWRCARRRVRRWCCCSDGTRWSALYTHDAAVAALAASLLLYAAAFQFPDGIQVLSAGALRGLKDTRVPMFLAAFAYWGIGMPLGAAGLGPGGSAAWGPRGMWIGLIAGLTVAAILLGRRFLISSRRVPIVAERQRRPSQ